MKTGALIIAGMMIGFALGAAVTVEASTGELRGRHTHALEIAGGSEIGSQWYPMYYDASENRIRAVGLPYTALPEVLDNGAHLCKE